MSGIGHREGTEVAYAGNENSGLSVGDVGKVLAASGLDTHVRWNSGARQGQIDLIAAHDLVPHAPEGSQRTSGLLDDSLEYGSLVTFSAKEVYATEGAEGLLDALLDEGHLSSLSGDVEEMVDRLVAQVRGDLSVRAVVAQLDEDEAEEFVMLVANSLLSESGVTDGS